MTTTSTPHPMPLTIHNTDFSSADASDAKSDTSDLSDSQISSLLQAAETRLQQRTQKQITTSIQTNSAAAGFPRLDPGQIAKPYVTTENGVAKVDGRRMVPVGKLEGDGVRIVEPIITKGRDVCPCLLLIYLLCSGGFGLRSSLRETYGLSFFSLPFFMKIFARQLEMFNLERLMSI